MHERKADLQLLKELAIRQREDFCAAHIGKLTGPKHEAALKWFHAFRALVRLVD